MRWLEIPYAFSDTDFTSWEDSFEFSNITKFNARGAGQIEIDNGVPIDLELTNKIMNFVVTENPFCLFENYHSVRIDTFDNQIEVKEITEDNLTYSIRCVKD